MSCGGGVSIRFPLPDQQARAEIFSLYTKHLSSADRARLAAATAGMSVRHDSEARR